MEKFQLKRLCKAPFYSVMADECIDITTIVELSLFFRWAEDGEPVEHFFDIIPLKKADAASIYTTLTDWFKQKVIQPSKLVGMGFDGNIFWSQNWSPGETQEEYSSSSLCSLSLPHASTCLHSSCQPYSWN